MRSRNKSIEDKSLDLLLDPVFNYKGVPVSALGLPTFRAYKRQSVVNTLYRFRKNEYVKQKGDYISILPKGRKYIQERASRLLNFSSKLLKEAPKNFLVIFDIPEARKAERDWFRFHLRKFGYLMIQRSVWVGPSPLPKDFVEYVKRINLKKCIKTFKLAKGYTLTSRSRS